MKTNNKLKTIISRLVLLAVAFALYSCYDKTNDWLVDSAYEKLFRPLKFEQKSLESTSVDVVYTQVIGAVKYEFNISNDSLDFITNMQTIEVLADTLTPSANSSNASRVEYTLRLTDLDASAKHSVRMRAVDKNGIFSEYVQLYFETPDENIFLKDAEVTNNEITVKWEQTDKVTHLDVIEEATGVYILEKYELTGEDKSAALKAVQGLQTGTYYSFIIYNNDKVRGQMSVKTSGTAGSESYNVMPGDDIAAILAEYLMNGTYNVTLNFDNAETYDFSAENLSIPAGMISVTFSAPTGVAPELMFKQVGWMSDMESLIFENVNITGPDLDTYFINTNVSIENIIMNNCAISTFRSLVRIQNSAITVNKISVNNCLISNTGGYGVFNVGGNTATLGQLELTESTLVEISTQLGDIRTPTESITVRNCTFYNSEQKYNQIFRFNDAAHFPATLTFEKCIFSGKNTDQTCKGIDKPNAFTFASCYRTSDFKEGTPKFTDITVYNGTAADLFTNPDGGDFTIKAGAGFAGENIAGDPRWFR